jgi:hypothetical protein
VRIRRPGCRHERVKRPRKLLLRWRRIIARHSVTTARTADTQNDQSFRSILRQFNCRKNWTKGLHPAMRNILDVSHSRCHLCRVPDSHRRPTFPTLAASEGERQLALGVQQCQEGGWKTKFGNSAPVRSTKKGHNGAPRFKSFNLPSTSMVLGLRMRPPQRL